MDVQSKLSKLIDYHKNNVWVKMRLGEVDSRFSEEGMDNLYKDLVEHTKKFDSTGNERKTSLGDAIFNVWIVSENMMLVEGDK